MADINRDISRFYHRWHKLEKKLAANITILDFDYCPREHLVDLEPTFSHRDEALLHLENLREQLAATDRSTLKNPDFLTQKLNGSAAFLNALNGKHQPFDIYVRETMGIAPEPVPQSELANMRGELENLFSKKHIPFSREGKEVFDRSMVMEDPAGRFKTTIRDEAHRWVKIIQERIGLNADPKYDVEIANEDAYWSNWIDGTIDRGIRLRVNTHPRITFLKDSETGFAVHEIGAHALQVLELEASVRAGNVDSAALNLTVHNCEQFQFEGLAQSVIFLIAEEREIPEALELDLKLRNYHSAVSNNAQIELEAGRRSDDLVDHVLDQAPFL